MMRAAILAAGIGRRLALPEAPPKVPLRFGGESLLARQAELGKFLETPAACGDAAGHLPHHADLRPCDRVDQ